MPLADRAYLACKVFCNNRPDRVTIMYGLIIRIGFGRILQYTVMYYD